MFFITAFKLQLKRLIKAKVFILSIILMFLMFFLLGTFLNKNERLFAINVGLLFNDNSNISKDICKILSTNDIITLFIYNDEQQFENDIKAAKIECGYILDHDLDKKINTGEYSKLITSVSSPASVATGIVNEVIASALIRAISPSIATDFIADKLKIDDKISLSLTVNELIDGYYENDIFTKAVFSSKSPNSSDDISMAGNDFQLDYKWVLHGVISLFAIISILFYSASFINEKKSNVYTKLIGRTKIRFLMANMCAQIVINIIFMSVGLFFINIIFNGTYNILPEIILIVVYSIALSALGLFIVSILKNADLIYSAFPVLVVSLILFGGVFFNLGELNPMLEKISLFFLPNHYLTALNNTYINNDIYYCLKDSGMLLIISLVLIISSLAIPKIKTVNIGN